MCWVCTQYNMLYNYLDTSCSIGVKVIVFYFYNQRMSMFRSTVCIFTSCGKTFHKRDWTSKYFPLVNSVPVEEMIICYLLILGATVVWKNEMVSTQCCRLRWFYWVLHVIKYLGLLTSWWSFKDVKPNTKSAKTKNTTGRPLGLSSECLKWMTGLTNCLWL